MTTAPTKAARPCDDPFCSGANACGWTAAEHLRPNQGGRDIAPKLAGVSPVPLQVPGHDDGIRGNAPVQAWDTEKRLSPAGPPPSTLDTMRDVLTDLDASRPRSQQTSLGASELGTPCTRQIAMKLAGIPRRPQGKRPPWAPIQGTAMHALMEEALHHHNAQLGRQRWVIEERLEIATDLSGSLNSEYDVHSRGDAYDLDWAMVVDWKYVGTTALREVKRKTIANSDLVKPEYRIQAHLYGYGHWRAGREPKWVRLVFLARSHDFDDSAEWTEPYDKNIAVDAINRYYATIDMLKALPVATAPSLWAAVPATPGKTCDWCPFRRPGPADATGCPGDLDQKTAKQMAGLIP